MDTELAIVFITVHITQLYGWLCLLMLIIYARIFAVRATMLSRPLPSFIVGPYDPIVKLVADDIRAPYLVTSRPEFVADDREAEPVTMAEEVVFHLIPGHDVISTAVADVIRSMRWEDVAVVYSSQRGASY